MLLQAAVEDADTETDSRVKGQMRGHSATHASSSIQLLNYFWTVKEYIEMQKALLPFIPVHQPKAQLMILAYFIPCFSIAERKSSVFTSLLLPAAAPDAPSLWGKAAALCLLTPFLLTAFYKLLYIPFRKSCFSKHFKN